MKTNKTMEIPEMLLMQNPYNGKQIDMKPMMELLNSDWEDDNGPNNVSNMIQKALDYFCIYAKFEDGLEDFQTAIFYLTVVRKAFDEMKELR